MNLLKLFKRKLVPSQPLWETDFEAFAKEAGEQEIDEYVKTLPEGREIDLINGTWGYSFSARRRVGGLIHYGSGFYGSLAFSKKVTEGDILLLKTETKKIGKYLVLKVTYERDPNDMFWAYVVCTGYKE